MSIDESSHRNSSQSSKRQSASGAENAAFWQSVDSLHRKPVKFSSGKLLKIDSKRIRATLLLCEAKLVCLEKMPNAAASELPLYLSKVLAELDHNDLAIELALASDVSPAYAIATLLEKLKN